MEFSFFSPVKLIFGRPLAQALPEALTELRTRRALLVSDPGLVATGLVDLAIDTLATSPVAVASFVDVHSNPTVRDVEAGLEAARSQEADTLVALGGGSAIDVAKAVGLLMSHGGTYADYQWRGRPIDRPILPVIAVPTTAGTGSEVTKVTVIADEETHFKKGVVSPCLFPRIAIVDPALTVTLSPRLTATTGVDVLAHALEAFVGRRANPVSDALALTALRAAWRFLPRATRHGDDLEARREMALASTLAGMAFDASGLGIIHALAGPLAGCYDLHHGLSVGLLLVSGFAYNLRVLDEKREQLLSSLGLPSSVSDGEAVQQVRTWVRDLGLPLSLGELGIREADLAALAEEASRMVMLPNNPRPATVDDCRVLLEEIR